MNTLSIKISGPAGSGIIALGEILAASFGNAGFYTLVYPEYPSRIRGGDNNVQIVVSQYPNIAPREKVDILFAMDKDLEIAHKDEIRQGGVALESGKLGVDRIADRLGNPIVKNAAAAGVIWKLCGLSPEVLFSQIRNVLGEKNLARNLKAAKAGFKLDITRLTRIVIPDSLAPRSLGAVGIRNLDSRFRGNDTSLSKAKIFGGTGNEVFVKGIEKAGVEYASIYPMTPITSLLNALAKTKIKMIVPEDEIFAALSTVGASYAGKRALTATSGGGFCLMTEAIGLAGMAEVPLVVILGQRTGPSSGFPTFTAQSDLNFAIHSSHGEFPKIVLAPGDLREIAELTQEAFNLADRYQIPVILLTDKYLSESRFSTDDPIDKIKIKIDRGKRYKAAKTYSRYDITSDGISPRAYPGETAFLTNSYEHDENGFSIDDAETRRKMVAKRARKLGRLKGGFKVFGDKKSKTLIVGWGSTKTTLLELISDFPQLKYIHISRVWPFPEGIKDEAKKASKMIAVENNFSGQMAKIIQNETGIEPDKILKDDGRPFFKEELIGFVESKL